MIPERGLSSNPQKQKQKYAEYDAGMNQTFSRVRQLEVAEMVQVKLKKNFGFWPDFKI